MMCPSRCAVWIALLWMNAALPFVNAQRTKLSGNFAETRLLRDLMASYPDVGTFARPVSNSSASLVVEYGLGLIQILEMNEKEQTLTINAWSRYKWFDQHLMWDPKKYNDLKTIRISPNTIWTPDIYLYNSADERNKEDRDTLAVVYNSGEVVWVPPVIYKSTCKIDITYFPYDQQFCVFKFGSWTYDSQKINISFFGGKSKIDLENYVVNNEWEILGTQARRNEYKYPCCEEAFPDLTFYLGMQRNPSFYTYLLVFPAVLLSILTLVTFWLPPESPAKMVLGMIIFVAFFLLLLLLSEFVPTASSGVPRVGKYYALNMVLITISTFLSVIVINMYFHGQRSRGLPSSVKKAFHVLGRVFCVRHLEVLTDSHDSQQLVLKDEPDPDKIELTDTNEEMKNVAGDVGAIRKALRLLMVRLSAKDAAHRIVLEWHILAKIVDRFLFCCYLVIVIIAALSLLTVKYEKISDFNLVLRKSGVIQ